MSKGDLKTYYKKHMMLSDKQAEHHKNVAFYESGV